MSKIVKEYFSDQDFERIPATEIGIFHADDALLVSVLMLAFDHENYIKEAIESVLSQKCSFPFELIIGEDYSNDRTRNICLDYQKRFPDKIRIIYSDENVGMHRNFARIWHRARGKYVVFLEGDDYWTSAEKLSKQARLMDANPDFSMCGACTEIIKRDAAGIWKKTGGRVGPGIERASYSFEDLIPSYTFHFSSVMVLKEAVRFPRWFWDVYCVDRPLYLLCTQNGPAGFIPEAMSVYRHHEGGIWLPLSWEEKAKRSEHLFRVLGSHFGPKYSAFFREALYHILWSYMSEALERGDRRGARNIYWKAMRIGPWRLTQVNSELPIAVFIRLYMPSLYMKLKAMKWKNDR